jgi:hypothetical protein
MVCNALRTPLAEGHVTIVSEEGPASGQSTTVAVVYAIQEQGPSEAARNPLWSLRGAGKEVFKALGGAEAFIRSERAAFYGSKEEE